MKQKLQSLWQGFTEPIKILWENFKKLEQIKNQALLALILIGFVVTYQFTIIQMDRFAYWLIQPSNNMLAFIQIKKAEAVKLTPIQEFYYRFENDLKFRNYITNLKVRRNNPGNLKFKNQPGAVSNNGFAEFKTPILGFRALILQTELYQSRNVSIRQFLSKYSPHNDNDTEHLIACMSDRLGVPENTDIKEINTVLLAQDITRQEFSIKY